MRRTTVVCLLSIMVSVFQTGSLGAQEIDYSAEISDIDRQIIEAEKESKKYSGGLILGMIKLRISLLKSSRALINQGRIQDSI